MDGLPRDTHGNYRGPGEDVVVGIFTGPSPLLVQALMDELVAWLRRPSRTAPLVRSALLHLNVIAIHPFRDGNGRTARILAAMELLLDGVRSPELISIEAYLRRNRDEYVDALRTTLGPSSTRQPSRTGSILHRISLDRLGTGPDPRRCRPTSASWSPRRRAGEPLAWAVTLLAARVSRMRTATLAGLTGRSTPAARAELGRMTRAGWLEPRGATRGRWYAPSERLNAIPLHVPALMRLLAAGERLILFDEELSR